MCLLVQPDGGRVAGQLDGQVKRSLPLQLRGRGADGVPAHMAQARDMEVHPLPWLEGHVLALCLCMPSMFSERRWSNCMQGGHAIHKEPHHMQPEPLHCW